MKVKHCSCPGPRYSNLVDLCGTQEWGVFIIRRLLGILRFQYHSAWTWKTLWFLPESSHIVKLKTVRDFAGGPVVKNPPANAGDMGSTPGLGGSHVPWSN